MTSMTSAQQDGLILMSMCNLFCVHMLVTKTIPIHFLLAYKDNNIISSCVRIFMSYCIHTPFHQGFTLILLFPAGLFCSIAECMCAEEDGGGKLPWKELSVLRKTGEESCHGRNCRRFFFKCMCCCSH